MHHYNSKICIFIEEERTGVNASKQRINLGRLIS